MSAQIIDGKMVSQTIRTELKARCEAMRAGGIAPGLAVVIVGENPASMIYVRNKARACEEIGLYSRVVRMPEACTQAELEAQVLELNRDASIHGILVQLPLPKHLDEARVLTLIDPAKDVDAFHAVNAGKLFSGQPDFVPCTPRGAMELLRRYGITVAGREAVVVGRSNIVGKPMAMLLLQENATVTVCHSRTADLAYHTRRADILVVAIGRAGLITGDMIKPGAVVIDVGINRIGKRVVGDVDFDSAREVAGHITPVPGGVGVMTITMLLANTLDAAARCAANGA